MASKPINQNSRFLGAASVAAWQEGALLHEGCSAGKVGHCAAGVIAVTVFAKLLTSLRRRIGMAAVTAEA